MIIDNNNLIVVNYHVPKTGGESINWYIQQQQDTDITKSTFRGHNRDEFIPYIQNLCSSNSKPHQFNIDNSINDNTLKTTTSKNFVEIHIAGPNWLDSIDDLVRIRNEECPNSSLYIMTTVREPISWYISSFNFHCGGVQNEDCGPQNSTGLQLSSKPNPQCKYFISGWEGYTYPTTSATSYLTNSNRNIDNNNNNDRTVTDDKCHTVVMEKMMYTMDYIGITANLDQTFRWLQSVGMGKVQEQSHINKGPKSPFVTLSTLPSNLKTYLEIISNGDRIIYERVVANNKQKGI